MILGLAVSVVMLVLYGTVTEGWMIYPVMAFGGLRLGSWPRPR